MNDLAWNFITTPTTSVASDPALSVSGLGSSALSSIYGGDVSASKAAGDQVGGGGVPRAFAPPYPAGFGASAGIGFPKTYEGAGDVPLWQPATIERRQPLLRQWVLVALGSVGIGLEFVRSSGAFGIIGVLCVVLAVFTARLAVPTESRGSGASRTVAAVVGVGAAIGMLWRANTTLRILDAAAIIVALPFAASVSFSSTSLLVRTVITTVLEPVAGFLQAIASMVEFVFSRLGRMIRRVFREAGEDRSTQVTNVGRIVVGLAIAVPVVGLLGLLLGSADAVFASFFRMPDVDLSSLDTLMVSGGAAIFFALVFAAPIVSGAEAKQQANDRKVPRRSSPIEVMVVLGAMNALFGLFCLSQIVSIGGAQKHVLETSGLTYAEYARSGFFQLLVVSVLTLGIIGSARAVAGPAALSHHGLRWCSALTALLTLGITAVAMNRLSLYMRAYGLTVDRIVSQAGTLTIAVVFVLAFFGIVFSRPGRDLRGFTTTASVGVAALAILGLHVANPSAWSARDGFAHGGVATADRNRSEFDTSGLLVVQARGETYMELDEDSVPAYVERAKSDPQLAFELCSNWDTGSPWHAWTLAGSRANAALRSLCS